MKTLILTLAICLGVTAIGRSQTTFGVQYQLSGAWIGTGTGVTQPFFTSVKGPNSGTNSYSDSVPYQFICTFHSTNSTKTPVATGSVTINLTAEADTGALIVGATGTATATAACSSVNASSSQTGAGSDPHTNGPTALPTYVISGSVLTWSYDAANVQWVGIASIVTISSTGSVSYTKAGLGDTRDQASANSTVGTGTNLITSNTMVFTQ